LTQRQKAGEMKADAVDLTFLPSLIVSTFQEYQI